MNPEIVKLSVAAMLAAATFAVHSVALSKTWTVTSYGDDPNDATTLRGALHGARDGDTIDLTGVTGVIYLTHGAAQILRELPVIYSVTIKGPGPDKLAIDGYAFSTVFRVYTGADVTISGLTIRDGKATQVLDTAGNTLGLGGGIVNSGTLTLTNCAISGNVAYGGGGGIMNEPGKTLTLTSCTVSNNYAKPTDSFLVPATGSAIWNSPARLVDPASFTPGTVTIVDTTIDYNNYNGPYAEAIVNEGTLTITGGEVSFNEGGAISNDGTLTLTDVTLGANDGGAIGNGGNATVTGSTLVGNSNAAISNGGTLRLSNSTIVASQPMCSLLFGCDDSGHGIINSGLTIVINSTITGNAGFGLTQDFGVEYFLKNTILAHNHRGNCDSYRQTIESEGHNISDDTSCATFLSAANDFAPGTDPGLDANGLKDNGGPTQTIGLTLSSVAVDAIPQADCNVATDQRGIARPQGKGCDIGAYEAEPNFYFSPIVAGLSSVAGSQAIGVQGNSFVGFHEPIILTAAAAAGLSLSFSPNPLTPTSYGSATSTLSVNLGPSVTPGNYRITVTGTSGKLSSSTSTMLTVGATTAGVSRAVDLDQAAACIDSPGVATGLKSQLAQAQAYIDGGDITDAKSTLNASLNLLQAQRGKHIHTTCTVGDVTFDPDAVLTTDVQALLASF